MELYLNKDTQLCMSLAARPGNFGTRFHNFLYRELGLNFIIRHLPRAISPRRLEEFVHLESADALFRCHSKKDVLNI